MVGYDPKNTNFNHTEQFYIGAATSIASRFIVQPLDVVKIRFQLQHEAISKKSFTSKYQSIGQCVTTIFREEGILGLWKGHLTGQILSFSFITTQFMWFNKLTKTAFLRYSFGDSPANHFVCGGLAAGFAVLSSQPIDVVRTRLVAQGEPRVIAFNSFK
jgi:solute carrier family 25 thiamine pyrophosphate transporter 19